MDNVKIALNPPYSRDKESYVSKVEMSAEFGLQSEALMFVSELNALILKFNNKETNNA